MGVFVGVLGCVLCWAVARGRWLGWVCAVGLGSGLARWLGWEGGLTPPAGRGEPALWTPAWAA